MLNEKWKNQSLNNAYIYITHFKDETCNGSKTSEHNWQHGYFRKRNNESFNKLIHIRHDFLVLQIFWYLQ